MTDMLAELDQTLSDVAEYMANIADVVDGDYGEPAPNKEMVIAANVKTAAAFVSKISEMLAADMEYDVAHALYFKPDGTVHYVNSAAMFNAEVRRAAAIRAMRGES